MWRWPFGGPWVPRHGSLNQYGCAVPSSRTKYGLSKFFDAVNILCKSSDVLISWVCRVREYKDLKKLSDPTSISLSGWIFQAEIGLFAWLWLSSALCGKSAISVTFFCSQTSFVSDSVLFEWCEKRRISVSFRRTCRWNRSNRNRNRRF